MYRAQRPSAVLLYLYWSSAVPVCAAPGCAGRRRICQVFAAFYPFRTLVAMKIAIAGASGRMGRMLIETVLNDSDTTLSGALDRAGSPQLGQDAGAFLGKQTGVLLTDDVERVFAESDYLIDFTRPEGTLMHLEAAQRHNVKMGIGTTGFDNAQKAQLRAAADKIAVMLSSNMSVGVNVTLKLLEYAAKHFPTASDINTIQAHHP